jgi:hypothetical protein
MPKSSGSPVSLSGWGVKSVLVAVTWTAVVWLPIRAPVIELVSRRLPNDCCVVRSAL